jgi:hypothetical protein
VAQAPAGSRVNRFGIVQGTGLEIDRLCAEVCLLEELRDAVRDMAAALGAIE